MSYVEHASIFECTGETLVAITSVPDKPATSTGVLIIIGGPQYRVGSHRQFVLLSRSLADCGIACMRFDYRGTGDATGDQHSFEAIDNDIRAAIDYFYEEVPSVQRVVLWGLCDGASAACLYAPLDSRVAAVILLNPWVRTDSGEAKTYLKHYYLRRIFDPEFWKKLLRRQVAVSDSITNFLRALRLARPQQTAGQINKNKDLPTRMAEGLLEARIPMLFVLSGNDYVANEFEGVCREHPNWSNLKASAAVESLEFADHTFSKADWRDAVARATANWVLNVADI